MEKKDISYNEVCEKLYYVDKAAKDMEKKANILESVKEDYTKLQRLLANLQSYMENNILPAKTNEEENFYFPSFDECQRYTINNKDMQLCKKMCSIESKILVVKKQVGKICFDIPLYEAVNTPPETLIVYELADKILYYINVVKYALEYECEPKAGSLNGERENGMKESQQEPDGEGAGTPTNEEESVPEWKKANLPILNNTDLEKYMYWKAVKEGYMFLNDDGMYEWDKEKYDVSLLGFMCCVIYCEYGTKCINPNAAWSESKKYELVTTTKTLPKGLRKFFINDISKAKKRLKTPPPGHEKITAWIGEYNKLIQQENKEEKAGN